jgi:hypothetical protein
LASKVKDKKKKKDKKKDSIDVLILLKNLDACKSSCCEKYKKNEKKRCKRCPMFDLLKSIN